MYKSISIENFRCFENTKIEGFEQINLIGGQNNAGKTALLEALYFAASPDANRIYHIEFNNRHKIETAVQVTETWHYLFYNKNISKEINISALTKDKGDIEVSVKHLREKVTKLFVSKTPNINDATAFDTDDFYFSNLKIDYKNKNNTGFSTIKFEGNAYQVESSLETPILKSFFINSFRAFNSKNLADSFDNNKLGNLYSTILKGCQIIDKAIEAIDTFNSEIYLKRKNEDFIPLSLWGDAMNKIMGYFLSIISFNKGIILIDEIENGIHHTNQRKLWKMLFDLAKEFDVQVFATSHSAEMIAAFQDVAVEHKAKGAYFTLNRHAKTKQILGLKTQLDTLSLKVEHKMNFRGE